MRLGVVRGPALLCAVLTVTLWGSVDAALAGEGAARVALASWPGASYASDARTFGPVSLNLVSELIGDSLLSPPPLPTRGGPAAGSPLDHRKDFRNDQVVDPPLATPRLTSAMHADRDTAQQGEIVTFTVTVRNIGTAWAEDVQIEYHIPDGTHEVGDRCDGGPLALRPDGGGALVCVDANSLVGVSGGHYFRRLPLGLGPDAWTTFQVRVRVDVATPDGTLLTNHAHAFGRNAPLVTSPTVKVVVV